jgi:adsorption protein B
MLENTFDTLEYGNFTLFCGTYPNDPATGAVVDRMARRYKGLVHVRLPHDGPSCKADCLNWIVQAAFLHEKKHRMEFAGFVLHDSEDVVHPLELQLFSYLLPRKDFIQLPVMALEHPWHRLVAGIYVDEFAEWHSKDLVVREAFTGHVPSAGVGTCFSARAIRTLAAQRDNQPFNTDSLAEDYDFSHRLKQLGMSQIFVRFPVAYKTTRRNPITGRTRQIEIDSTIAVREFFPDTFRSACVQRARWILGIVFQGWLEMGWQGDWRSRYMLLRDRKGIVTSIVSILGYFVAFNFLLAALWAWLDPTRLVYASLIASHDWMQLLIAINVFMLLNRVGHRFFFVSLSYGWWQGLMAVPRMVVSNVVNFVATIRAWRIFLAHVLLGRQITWDKTEHAFPSTERLQYTRRQLGELLLAWRAIDSDQLSAALTRHTNSGELLGRILVQEGWVSEETLAEALCYQHDLPRGALDMAAVRANRHLLPLDLIVRHRVLPAGVNGGGALHVYMAGAASFEVEAAIQEHHDGPVAVHIVHDSEIADALRQLVSNAPDQAMTGRPPLLGDLLVASGAVRRQAIEAAVREYSADRDGRFGSYLVTRGVVTQAQLDNALEEQRRAAAPSAPGVG